MKHSFNFPYEKVKNPDPASSPCRIVSKFERSVFLQLIQKEISEGKSLVFSDGEQSILLNKHQSAKRPLTVASSAEQYKISKRKRKLHASHSKTEPSYSPTSSLETSLDFFQQGASSISPVSGSTLSPRITEKGRNDIGPKNTNPEDLKLVGGNLDDNVFLSNVINQASSELQSPDSDVFYFDKLTSPATSSVSKDKENVSNFAKTSATASCTVPSDIKSTTYLNDEYSSHPSELVQALFELAFLPERRRVESESIDEQTLNHLTSLSPSLENKSRKAGERLRLLVKAATVIEFSNGQDFLGHNIDIPELANGFPYSIPSIFADAKKPTIKISQSLSKRLSALYHLLLQVNLDALVEFLRKRLDSQPC